MGFAQVLRCENLFKPKPQINVFYVSHYEDKISLGPEVSLTIQKSETSHRHFFQVLADFPVADKDLLRNMEILMAPSLQLSPYRKVPMQSFEILAEDLFLWFDSLGLLKSIAAVYPESTKVLISKMEVIPNLKNQKLRIAVSFHLMNSLQNPENLESHIPKLLKKIQANLKNERSLFFWKIEPQFHLKQFVLNTNYQYFSMDAQNNSDPQKSLREDSDWLLQLDVPTSFGLFPLHLLSRKLNF